MNTENTLWTRDFTIITIGSVISMLGNAMSGFAISLMVLDFTESTMLYAIFLAVFTIPQI
ncbi:MAG TPA: MFS transporter, partial [Erysipelotrichaceae bacterium]|nr:MFS transporter [Erysipelotrichaceae bacterium]